MNRLGTYSGDMKLLWQHAAYIQGYDIKVPLPEVPTGNTKKSTIGDTKDLRE